ncbi:MAG: ABC transporter permease subunit, partial [Clostridia bacterium]
LIPAVTYFFMEGGRLLGGAVLTETVFALNGIGRYLVTSIAFRDYPAVVGVTCFIAACVTLSNAAADLLCRCLDPRARRGKG